MAAKGKGAKPTTTKKASTKSAAKALGMKPGAKSVPKSNC